MYLSEDLITSVKRRCNVPTSQITFQTADFLALADEEIRAKLVPHILKQMEEFYVTYEDYSIVNGTSRYTIHPRAIGMALRGVGIVSPTDLDNPRWLERLNPEDTYGSIAGRPGIMIQKSGFYLEGNNVVLYPPPGITEDLLRQKFPMRPNTLISTSSCGLITAIDTTLKQVTVSSAPSGITASTLVDLVKAEPGFECKAIDQTLTGVSGTVYTFEDNLPDDLAVGDYVCPAAYSCVVQVPVELQPLLFQYVVVRILSSQSDRGALSDAKSELEVLEKAAGMMISPRVTGAPKRVINSRSIARLV